MACAKYTNMKLLKHLNKVLDRIFKHKSHISCSHHAPSIFTAVCGYIFCTLKVPIRHEYYPTVYEYCPEVSPQYMHTSRVHPITHEYSLISTPFWYNEKLISFVTYFIILEIQMFDNRFILERVMETH